MTEYSNDYVVHHPLIQKPTDDTESAEFTGSFVQAEIKRLKKEIKDRENELGRLENRLIFGSRGDDGEYGKGIAEVDEYGRVKFTELAINCPLSAKQAKNFAAWVEAAVK